MATPVWIGLGSNLGDRRGILEAAVTSLSEVPGVAVRTVSGFHETKPIGGPPGQGPFLNGAAHLETSLDPYQLLAALQEIENHAGRVRVVRWGERTLDLDILIFGTKFLDTKELKLPHPRLALRRFVLAPLAEIAPHIVDTMTKRTIADLLANLGKKPKLLELVGTEALVKSIVLSQLIKRLSAFEIVRPNKNPHRGKTAEFREVFADKIEALGADQWKNDSRWVMWGVGSYFVDPKSIAKIADDKRFEKFIIDEQMPESIARLGLEGCWVDRVREARWVERIQKAKDEAVEPMFVVCLPLADLRSRRPGVSSVPQLWPESADPEAIVAEVLATCRGIEGI